MQISNVEIETLCRSCKLQILTTIKIYPTKLNEEEHSGYLVIPIFAQVQNLLKMPTFKHSNNYKFALIFWTKFSFHNLLVGY